jgi:glyoxylase-like metal-dependent hydrolase (beta-lactamase superfamily II)
MKKLHSLVFIIFTLSSVFSQNIKVDRISKRIIILNEDYFRSVAIYTNKGVVLIDTREPLEKMEEIKQIIKQEFKTDTFCYIINTHGCPEHILGNPAFPNTPVIMNENFFNRKKMYARQKKYIDSLEIVCNQTNDTVNQDEKCTNLDGGRNWRNYCIKALKIKPDISYSKKMNLYFDSLTIQMVFTGLVHGYSTFIYIPEENFLHVSTLSSKYAITKFRIPENLDASDFLPYQVNTLKDIIGISNSIKYVVPCHGDYYSSGILKQMLGYYTDMYYFAKKSYSSKMKYNTFKSECTIAKRFSTFELFQNLNEEELQRHNENIDWLWNYFKQQDDNKQ